MQTVKSTNIYKMIHLWNIRRCSLEKKGRVNKTGAGKQ